jgi:hypothetical protein
MHGMKRHQPDDSRFNRDIGIFFGKDCSAIVSVDFFESGTRRLGALPLADPHPHSGFIDGRDWLCCFQPTDVT